MALPVVPLATGSVTVAGTDVAIRSLSRDDVVRLADIGPAEAEVLIIAAGTGVTPEEADAWRKSVDAKTANELLTAVAVLSGIREPASGKR